MVRSNFQRGRRGGAGGATLIWNTGSKVVVSDIYHEPEEALAKGVCISVTTSHCKPRIDRKMISAASTIWNGSNARHQSSGAGMLA